MGRAKDLNMGQSLGDGKLQVKYPGLNEDIQLKSTELPQMKVIGEDLDREKRLTEIRNKMDRFKHISVSPFDRGFTSSSIAGKPIGPPDSYEDGSTIILVSNRFCLFYNLKNINKAIKTLFIKVLLNIMSFIDGIE